MYMHTHIVMQINATYACSHSETCTVTAPKLTDRHRYRHTDRDIDRQTKGACTHDTRLAYIHTHIHAYIHTDNCTHVYVSVWHASDMYAYMFVLYVCAHTHV
jgi:hypothetical protein